MKTPQHNILNGNQATAHIAYKINEVCAIYPITPSSEMSELVEEWSSNQKENIFGHVPSVFEMQSEAGVAGAMHGAIQTGALATTFTASQGLLLMIPNMYKIAGELTPNVIHVATRSVATHALSVFGDHSDIMAARSTGYAFLGSSSVQEAMDLALISQTSSLVSRIPFVHFFDGFRTSHETATIEMVSDEVITSMIDDKTINAHKKRALNPNSPVIRGTSQGPDVFFQSREAVNPFYQACPEIVQNEMNKFFELTGRAYKIFDYVGHPEAEHIIVAMASATETIETTIKKLNQEGERIGLVKVRLFRPFSAAHLIKSIPATCKSIAVLDRTKEPGGSGEPLYLDVVQSIAQNSDRFNTFPKIIGGRYGLSSKEFNPTMVLAVLNNLKSESPKNNFTVGINDDVTQLSLPMPNELNADIEIECGQALFFSTKRQESNDHFNNYLKLLGNERDTYVQGFTECDYKKSNSRMVSHVRISSQVIQAPYLISNADFIGCDDISFLKEDHVLSKIKSEGKIIVESCLDSAEFWSTLSENEQRKVQEKRIELYILHPEEMNAALKLDGNTISRLHACHLALNDELLKGWNLEDINKYLQKVDTSKVSGETPLEEDQGFSETLLGKLLSQQGNNIPVSALPVDGTFESNTSEYNLRKEVSELPIWDTDLCTQCGACSMACPQGALRIKAFSENELKGAPSSFKSVNFLEKTEDFDLLNYTVQVNPDQCTSCNNCVDACPAKALVMHHNKTKIEAEKKNWEFFTEIPEFDRTKIDVTKISQQQLQEPLFKYAMGVDGCGEAPYLKLMSQLFGDRMVVANATGASSIFGGALPTTPWSKNKEGRGPAWSNSLFEDNAEFGLGFRLSMDQQEAQVRDMLKKMEAQLDAELVGDILNAPQRTETEIAQQRNRIKLLKRELDGINTNEALQLRKNLDSLIKKSVWIVGGDGWAYDIGYGGLDHVLASGKNVNILVLDNEVYSNTGGQMSKATPFGASAKFAAKGKPKQKKDLGQMAMNYDDVYVASVAIGADQEQTLKAFLEAEQHEGPSLIIAYCHSPAHGIDMKNPSQYHKAAVNSGQWPLYRNNPERKNLGLNSFQLDSDAPSIGITDYFRMEKRFDMLFQNDLETLEVLMEQAQKKVDERYANYQFKSGLMPSTLMAEDFTFMKN